MEALGKVEAIPAVEMPALTPVAVAVAALITTMAIMVAMAALELSLFVMKPSLSMSRQM